MKPWMMKAEHALRTGQPRLAELYMRRGLAEDPAGRAWLAFRDVAQAAVDTWAAIAEAYRPLVDFVLAMVGPNETPIFDQLQDDYALAGPSKGGA